MGDLKLTTVVDAENPVLHDLELRNGQLVWVGLDQYDEDDQAAMIAQRVSCALQLIRGEWYLDQREGLPYDVLSAKGTSVARMERIFRAGIEAVPGIRSVLELSIAVDWATRVASVTWKARGDAGAIIGPATLDVPFVLTGV